MKPAGTTPNFGSGPLGSYGRSSGLVQIVGSLASTTMMTLELPSGMEPNVYLDTSFPVGSFCGSAV